MCGEICGGFGDGQRNAEDGVGPQAGFVVGAIQFDHGGVDGFLFGGVKANKIFGNLAVYSSDGFQNAFAQVTGFVTVTFFDGFIGTG